MRLRITSFKIEEFFVELLDKYAVQNRTNRSEIIRKAIKLFLRQSQEDIARMINETPRLFPPNDPNRQTVIKEGKLRTVSIKMTEKMLSEIRNIANQYNVTSNHVIRTAIYVFLKDKLKDEIVPSAKIEKLKL